MLYFACPEGFVYEMKKRGFELGRCQLMLDSDVKDISFTSSSDGSRQQALLFLPEGVQYAPLVVGLHTWSYDRFNQLEMMLPHCRERRWRLLLPEFRGPNLMTNPHVPEAGGSAFAIQDVLDAVALVNQRYELSTAPRLMLGGSGGGHMALLVAAKSPTFWTGVSSWVPITDLVAWYQENPDYAPHIAAFCGGVQGAAVDVDRQYRQRSPLNFVQELVGVPLSVHHGRFDPVVPYRHSWRLAQALEEAGAKNFFFEIFPGGHEIKYREAFAWFDGLVRAAVNEDVQLTG